jgi:transcriptional regulator
MPAPDAAERGEMLQGMLDMLILKALQLEPMHGWGITERIHQWSDSVLQVNQGSLYPALYRLKRNGWIASAWKTTENNRRARYYSLTAAGRKQLAEDHRNWQRLARAVDVVMQLSAP